MTSPQTLTRPEVERRPADQPLRPWNVVLLDDNAHTYDYAIRMMQSVFRRSVGEALELAKTVDRHGRVVCCTTHREHAELKRDQIHSFGADPLIAACAGSMSALIEPAEGGEDDGEDRRPGA